MRNGYLALIVLGLLMTGCNDKNKDALVRIKTSYGDMLVLLYEETPKHKQNFLRLAAEGEYDSTIFHRVIEQFMIQGGDISQKRRGAQQVDEQLDAEFVPKFHHKKGALAAARQGDAVNPQKKSSGAQFYIVQGRVWSEDELTTDVQTLQRALGQLMQQPEYDTIRQVFMELQQQGKFEEMQTRSMDYKEFVEQTLGINLSREYDSDRLTSYTTIGGVPHLDDDYTVFGEVVEGLELVDKIAALETNPGDRPIQDFYMQMEIVEMPKKEISEKYGYTYPAAEE